jgi:hypothetical protein
VLKLININSENKYILNFFMFWPSNSK